MNTPTKTVLEEVDAPMASADEFAPADNEALNLAEEELDATKTALDSVDAENDRLHQKVREMEAALLDLWANITDISKVKSTTVDFAVTLADEVAARQPAPRFTRK